MFYELFDTGSLGEIRAYSLEMLETRDFARNRAPIFSRLL